MTPDEAIAIIEDEGFNLDTDDYRYVFRFEPKRKARVRLAMRVLAPSPDDTTIQDGTHGLRSEHHEGGEDHLRPKTPDTGDLGD